MDCKAGTSGQATAELEADQAFRDSLPRYEFPRILSTNATSRHLLGRARMTVVALPRTQGSTAYHHEHPRNEPLRKRTSQTVRSCLSGLLLRSVSPDNEQVRALEIRESDRYDGLDAYSRRAFYNVLSALHIERDNLL